MTPRSEPKDKIIGSKAITRTVKVDNFDALFRFENISIVKIIMTKVVRWIFIDFLFNRFLQGFYAYLIKVLKLFSLTDLRNYFSFEFRQV